MKKTLLAAAITFAAVLIACGSSTTANPDGGTGGGSGGGSGGGAGGGTGGGAGGGTGGGAGGGGGSNQWDGGAPTWYRDVQPIVQENCETCHRPSDIAPFSLQTYADAQPMAGGMAADVAIRRMPPWMPTDTCQAYQHERRLTQQEIDTIVAWNAAGAPEGDPADAPPPYDGGTGTLAQVDLTADPGADYTPPDGQSDMYRCFAIGSPFAAQEDVIGYDIAPGQRQEVHHVIVFAAPAADVANQDAAEAGLGWTCFGGSGINNATLVAGWAPGSPATVYPSGTGIRVPQGYQLVMQVHYNLNNTGLTGVPDRTQVKLQFAPSAVAKPAQILPVLNSTFQIAASPNGAPVQTTATGVSQGTPIPVQVWGVFPHMHQLGTKIRVSVTNSNTCFADIPQWDFHWQQMYLFKQPVSIPTGGSAKVECTWTNTENRTVTWGEGTSDEMCLAYLYLTF